MQGNMDPRGNKIGSVLAKDCLGSSEIDRDSVEVSKVGKNHFNLLIFSNLCNIQLAWFLAEVFPRKFLCNV